MYMFRQVMQVLESHSFRLPVIRFVIGMNPCDYPFLE